MSELFGTTSAFDFSASSFDLGAGAFDSSFTIDPNPSNTFDLGTSFNDSFSSSSNLDFSFSSGLDFSSSPSSFDDDLRESNSLSLDLDNPASPIGSNPKEKIVQTLNPTLVSPPQRQPSN